VLAVSLVQYKTGFRLDLDRVSALCRARGTALVLDATQAFGVIPIDLERTPVDALVFSGYKWATAGYGIAPLVVRRSLLEERGLPSVGWRSAREPYDLESTKLDPTTEARGLELGHPPFAGIFALRGALELIESIGLAAIEARVSHLLDKLHRGLEARDIPIDSPREHSARSPITMIRVPDPKATATALAERNVFVSARGEGLRVSVHYFNNEDDLEAFLEALAPHLG
jgi:selenocysteine lyase/cysteine desulfurase